MEILHTIDTVIVFLIMIFFIWHPVVSFPIFQGASGSLEACTSYDITVIPVFLDASGNEVEAAEEVAETSVETGPQSELKMEHTKENICFKKARL